MQEYLTRTPLGAALDRLCGTVLLLFGGICVFVLLWGLRLSALVAGIALGVMLLTVREQGRKNRLHRRESALRRRIGGEMKLEQWLLMQPRRAHLEAALLLSQECALTLERAEEDGAVCTLEKKGEKIVIFCTQMHEKEKVTLRDAAQYQRICLREKAERGVLCGVGEVSAQIRRQAEMHPPLQLISREKMISLAGKMWPATDEQLVELGKRRQRRRGKAIWQNMMTSQRERPYLFYGLLLCMLYLLTGMISYLLPALVCMVLLALCRTGRFAPESGEIL